MIKNILIKVLFKLIYSLRQPLLKSKERYKILSVLNTREIIDVLNEEQRILQLYYMKADNQKNRLTFKGGYMALEKLKLEIKLAKKKYFNLESTDNEEESTN